MLIENTQVMVHIVSRHPDQLCHLCGSQSPIFTGRYIQLSGLRSDLKFRISVFVGSQFLPPGRSHVTTHLRNCHMVDSPFSCPNCGNRPFFDFSAWLEHLREEHKWSNNENLRPLKRKRVAKLSKEEALSKVVL